MSVTDIKVEELRLKSGEEGLVFQGCGGDDKDWVEGINKLLKSEQILKNGTELDKCYRFENRGLTNLYFPFGNAELDIGRLVAYLVKALQEKTEAELDAKIARTDRKIRRKIAEKKQAQGLKLE